MKGKPVGVDKTVSKSPIMKQKVTKAMNPRAPLMNRVDSIVLGSVLEAFRSSSDMCTAASEPSKASVGLRSPTRDARPVLPQLPPSLKDVKTSFAGARSP